MSPTEVVQVAEMRAQAANGEARRRREAARVSARHVAEAVGVSHTAVLAWEAGKRYPNRKAALRWHRLLAELAEVSAG